MWGLALVLVLVRGLKHFVSVTSVSTQVLPRERVGGNHDTHCVLTQGPDNTGGQKRSGVVGISESWSNKTCAVAVPLCSCCRDTCVGTGPQVTSDACECRVLGLFSPQILAKNVHRERKIE